MKWLFYRIMRAHMVKNMRHRKFTWSKINTVLMSLGQDVITHYNHEKGGIRLFFGPPAKINRTQLRYGKPVRKSNTR